MLPRSTVDKLIPILMKDARRALRMRVAGFPGVYFCSFLLRDIEWFSTWAANGSMYRRRSDHTRNVYCDIRVGDYRYDQTTDGGLNDNDDDRDSVSHVTVPIDDRVYDGLRLALWRLSEAKFREALKDYSNKESARLTTPDPVGQLPSFCKLKKIRSMQSAQRAVIDEERWVKFVKEASRWISELPQLSTSWVEFDATQDSKIFVSTEGSVIVQHQQLYSLTATLRRVTSEGSTIEQDVVINCADLSEIPNMRNFKKLVLQKHEQLLKLARAKTIHAFSGPVLLYPVPAGLLFHEAVGHRLEGSRLLSAEEGQTFKELVGKPVLNVAIDISDNPRLKKFKGERCVGAYQYDDEGTPAMDAELIAAGELRGFLNTRAPTQRRKFEPNGHARSKKHQRPVSRMGVFIVKGRKTVSMATLRQKLIAEIKRQKKPFGMIVYQTSSGETDTTNYDFQAFRGEISYSTLVYPDGSEKVVRGVNIVGTPLQALNNIIAVGDEQVLDNAYCGAESGTIPVSTIAPAVLLSNLELQAKTEELVTPSILPKPKLSSE